MMTLVVLLGISVVTFVTGMAWTLTLRGHTTRRSGAEVGAEFLEEELARRAFRGGRSSLAGRAWFWGKGWAVEREGAFSYGELKTMWRKGAFGALLPMGLLIAGMLASIILGGLLMFLALATPIPGIAVMAMGLYGAWLVFTGIRRA